MARWTALAAALLSALATSATAGTLVATRTIRSHTILGPALVEMSDGEVPGALSDPEAAIGKEARVVLYAGRPIRPGDIGPAAIIERNAIVELVYDRAGLLITTEARALGRAGIGDTLRVMTLSSRNTVTGRVDGDGSVHVGPGPAGARR